MKSFFLKLLWSVTAICIVALALFSLGIIGDNTEKFIDETKSGFAYSGTVVGGKYGGIGQVVFDDGSRYNGGFSSGRFDGEGLFYSPGLYFQGTFSSGRAVSGAFYDENDGFLISVDDGELVING